MTEQETGKRRGVKLFLNAVILILILLILFLTSALYVFKSMGLTFCTVHGASMTPTIPEGATLLLNPEKDVDRFDIVVFKDDGRYLIKRMIGLPGDTVTVMDGKLWVNGEYYEESYLDDEYIEQFKEQDFKISVPDGQYFAMGDNRDGSFDSRSIGMITKDQFVGTAIFALP